MGQFISACNASLPPTTTTTLTTTGKGIKVNKGVYSATAGRLGRVATYCTSSTEEPSLRATSLTVPSCCAPFILFNIFVCLSLCTPSLSIAFLGYPSLSIPSSYDPFLSTHSLSCLPLVHFNLHLNIPKSSKYCVVTSQPFFQHLTSSLYRVFAR